MIWGLWYSFAPPNLDMEFEIDNTWVTMHFSTLCLHLSQSCLHVFHLHSPFEIHQNVPSADKSLERRGCCIVAQSLKPRKSRITSGVDDNPPPQYAKGRGPDACYN
jgi:hypothetical protein